MKNGPLAVEIRPAPDPWATAQRLAHLPHLLFLDSADRRLGCGRFTFLSADPFRFISNRLAPVAPTDLFADLAAQLAEFPFESDASLPPFQGGLAGLFGYGLGRCVERVPPNRFDDLPTPDLAVGLYDWVLAFDHAENRCWLISTGFPEREETRREERAQRRIVELQAILGEPSGVSRRVMGPENATTLQCPQYPLPGFPGVTSNFDAPSYLAAVRRAVEYVRAGDCFQVNLSQRLLAPLQEHPLELYGRLRERNPAPFACYFDLGEFVVAGASPERFLRVRGKSVETRPIKGTRPRFADAGRDASSLAELEANPKDRAENVMIVDLLRNDLGRVCEYGSVRVPEVCRAESFAYVHHLTSTVVGRLRADRTPVDLLRAAFPGGSVTGAPKVRAMEIIAELEPTARGAYCGSLGYIGFDGSMDTNISIRSFTCGGGWVQFPVGGGIVADSIPEREYEETLHKAAGMLKALR